MAIFLRDSKILSKLLTAIEKYSLLIAAICHDVDHTGRTNAFEIAKISKLSLKFNDESVLKTTTHQPPLKYSVMKTIISSLICPMKLMKKKKKKKKIHNKIVKKKNDFLIFF